MVDENDTIALIETAEMGVPAFRAGLLSWGPRILSPIECYPPYEESFVSLEEAIKQTNNIPNAFFPWIVTGGIGLYSLKKGPAGILTRWDVLFRNATQEEVARDFRYFGEQVMGPKVGDGEDEKYRNNARLRVFNSEFYYTGPPRVVKSRFATRAFSGDLPDREILAKFIAEVDKIGLTNEVLTRDGADRDVASQGYRLFQAKEGRMYHTGFGKFQDYNPDKMRELWGEVTVRGKKMTFYPKGQRDKSSDFSVCLGDLPNGFKI